MGREVLKATFERDSPYLCPKAGRQSFSPVWISSSWAETRMVPFATWTER